MVQIKHALQTLTLALHSTLQKSKSETEKIKEVMML